MRTKTSLPSLVAILVAANFLVPILRGAGLPDFSSLVDKAGPAVVNIRTTEKVAARARTGGDDDDDDARELFRRFFGQPGGEPRGALPRQHPPIAPKVPQAPQDGDDDIPGRAQADAEPERVQRGVGSGFIISQDGYVLTNAHVVEGADEVFVKLTDRREFKANVVGTSSGTKVGEWVIAIGSPFDLDNSASAGIVSAKARETGDFLPLIQTDMPINPGNSGGPLINMRGEVVGINSQIYSRSGGFMGISFAIPIEDAIRVADQLRNGGHVTRGRLGLSAADLTPSQKADLGPRKDVVVEKVDGAAEQAGLRPGDIVLALNNADVDGVEAFGALAGQATGGKPAVALVRRPPGAR